LTTQTKQVAVTRDWAAAGWKCFISSPAYALGIGSAQVLTQRDFLKLGFIFKDSQSLPQGALSL